MSKYLGEDNQIVDKQLKFPGDSSSNEEQLEMLDNHSQACEFIKHFMAKQIGHIRKEALDVGCGPGLFTVDILSK